MKILFIFAVLFLSLHVADWSFIRGGITNYPITCPADYTEGNGCYTLRQTTYYPDRKTQSVIGKNIDISKYTNCTVLNRKNWKCVFDDESAEFGFIEGRYYSVTLWRSPGAADIIEKLEKEQRDVSKIMYLRTYWGI